MKRTDADRVIAKVESIFTLSEDERQGLGSLPVQIAQLNADQDIVREGDRPSRSCVLIEGFAFASKVTAEGKRQILGIFVPGDLPDLQSLHLRIMDNSVTTMTAAKLGFIDHDDLRSLCERFPRIGTAFWRTTLIDAAILRERMIGIGRRQAHARVAHFLCELLVRLRAAGLASDRSCDLPITQGEIGDVLGLSTVHINRTLQNLRAAGLVSFKGSTLKVLDWDGLKQAGEFDPTYLHLEDRHAAD